MPAKSKLPPVNLKIDLEGPISSFGKKYILGMAFVVCVLMGIGMYDPSDPDTLELTLMCFVMPFLVGPIVSLVKKTGSLKINADGIGYQQGRRPEQFIAWSDIRSAEPSQQGIVIKSEKEQIVPHPFLKFNYNKLLEIIHRNTNPLPEFQLPYLIQERIFKDKRDYYQSLIAIAILTLIVGGLGVYVFHFSKWGAAILWLFVVPIVFRAYTLMKYERNDWISQYVIDQEGVEHTDSKNRQVRLRWDDLDRVSISLKGIYLIKGNKKIVISKELVKKEDWPNLMWWVKERLYPNFYEDEKWSPRPLSESLSLIGLGFLLLVFTGIVFFVVSLAALFSLGEGCYGYLQKFAAPIGIAVFYSYSVSISRIPLEQKYSLRRKKEENHV